MSKLLLFPPHGDHVRGQVLPLPPSVGRKLRFASHALKEVLGTDLVVLCRPAHDLGQHHPVAPVFERPDRDHFLARLVTDAGERELVLGAVARQMRPVHGHFVAVLTDHVLRMSGGDKKNCQA